MIFDGIVLLLAWHQIRQLPGQSTLCRLIATDGLVYYLSQSPLKRDVYGVVLTCRPSRLPQLFGLHDNRCTQC